MKHALKIMDQTGHSTTMFDPEVKDEVKEAKAKFDKAVREGMLGYRIDGPGQGSALDTFDPEAREIIMSPQLRGG